MSFGSHRVVAVTPAGRRRYLAPLIAYTHRDHLAGIVDEHRLVMNTAETEDIEWCKRISGSTGTADMGGFVTLEWLPGQAGGWQNIHKMFAKCTNLDTIYIRLDDDIVYIAPDAIWRLLQFRLENPGYFLVFANIVNNAICSHIHQRMGMTAYHRMPGYECMDEVGWSDVRFADMAHRAFLGRMESGTAGGYRFPRWELMPNERFSINAFAFKGRDFAEFGGAVGQDEEPWLTQVKTEKAGRINAICGTAMMSHFAFYTQREYLDSTDLLARYRDVARRECPDAPEVLWR